MAKYPFQVPADLAEALEDELVSEGPHVSIVWSGDRAVINNDEWFKFTETSDGSSFTGWAKLGEEGPIAVETLDEAWELTGLPADYLDHP